MIRLAGLGLWLLAAAAALAQQPNWDALDVQVEELYKKGDINGAIEAAQRALGIAATPKQTAQSLDRLGFLYSTLGKHKDGEAFLRKGLDLRLTLGRDTADYAESAINLAMLYRNMGRSPEARALAEEAAAIRARVLGPSNPLTAEALNILGSVYHMEGDYPKALSTYEKSLAIHQANGEPENPRPEYGTLCAQLAQLYQRLGRYPEADKTFEKALTCLRKNPGTSHPAYSTTLAASALLLQDAGKYAESEKRYVEALNLLTQQLPEHHPAISTVLNNQAMLYQVIGNLVASEASLRRSLAIKQKLGESPLSIATTTRNLGILVYRRDPAEGERMYRDAIKLLEKAPTKPAYEVANTLLALGEAEKDRGDLPAAAATLHQALDVVEKGFGTRHPLYARVSSQLGLVCELQGNPGEAEQRYRAAIDIIGGSKTTLHPDLTRHLLRLARLLTQKGDYRGAFGLFRQMFQIQQDAQKQVLGIGSEAAKTSMLANLEDIVSDLITLQRKAGQELPEARVLAFEAVTARKAKVLEYVRDWREELRRNTNKQVLQTLTQWQALIECRATLAVALGYRGMRRPTAGSCLLDGTDLAGRYQRLSHEIRLPGPASDAQALQAIGELTARIDQLEESLSRDVPPFRNFRQVRVDDIRSRLSKHEILLEFVAYEQLVSGHVERRYAVFLLDTAGKVTFVELGLAPPVDAAIRDLLESANDWSTALARHEKHTASAAQQTADHAAYRLSTQLLGPVWTLLKEYEGVRQLRIAPDGLLALLPFELLETDRRSLLDRFAISYVLAGRDLADTRSIASPINPPLIVLSPGATPKRPVLRSRNAFRTESLESLPGAREEARRLKMHLPDADVLAEGQATEEALKRVRSPAVLHIIGHGVIRGKEDCTGETKQEGCTALSSLDPATRVMSLAAIVLEEAYGRGSHSSQDGLLTALELRSLDLAGSEMLVLSQCRLADGVPTSSDGVYGMRRAAALAGVRSVVAPLWNVADSVQVQIMDRFYRELKAGQDRSEALRRAKTQIATSRQSRHFLYWAPLILTGDPGTLGQLNSSRPVPGAQWLSAKP